jgi:hypothetical protein
MVKKTYYIAALQLIDGATGVPARAASKLRRIGVSGAQKWTASTLR